MEEKCTPDKTYCLVCGDVFECVMKLQARLSAAEAVEAQAAAMREVLSNLVIAIENGDTCWEEPETCNGLLGQTISLNSSEFMEAVDLLSSSTAGAELLDRLEALRRENAELCRRRPSNAKP